MRKAWVWFWCLLAVVAFFLGEPGVWVGLLLVASLAAVGLGRKRRDQQITEIVDFEPDYRFEQPGSSDLLLIDIKSQQFATALNNVVRVYKFVKLVAVEVERDGITVQKSTRDVSLIGAGAGAILAGSVGAAVGLFAGGGSKSESQQLVSKLALKLTIADPEAPLFYMTFFKEKKAVAASDRSVAKATAQMEEWYGRLRGLIHGRAGEIVP